MPEIVTCPACDKKAKVPDNLIGTKVKCPGCAHVFMATVSGGRPTPPPPKTESKPEPRSAPERPPSRRGDEVAEKSTPTRRSREEDEEDDRPARSTARRSKGDEDLEERPRRRSREDEDEDEDDRPRSRSRSRRDEDDDEEPRPKRRSRRDEDEEEDDDDRPRGRSRRARDDDDDEDDDDRPKKRRTKPNWPRVSQGLTLILASVVVWIVGTILVVLVGFLVGGSAFNAAANPGIGPRGFPQGGMPPPQVAAAVGGGAIFLVILGGLIGLVTFGLSLVGHIFCLPSPEEKGARTLALVTLICFGGTKGLAFLALIFQFASGGMGALVPKPNMMATGIGASFYLNILAMLFSLAGIFIFLFYQRALALCLRGYDLAKNIMTFVIAAPVSAIVFALVSCGGMFVMTVGAAGAAAKAQQGGGNPDMSGLAAVGVMGIVCLITWLLYLLGMGIWWLIILIRTRSLVALKARR